MNTVFVMSSKTLAKHGLDYSYQIKFSNTSILIHNILKHFNNFNIERMSKLTIHQIIREYMGYHEDVPCNQDETSGAYDTA